MFQKYQEHLQEIEDLLNSIQQELVPLLGPLEEATGVKQAQSGEMVQKAIEGIKQNRKVKLGIIGQVKAGKSTLLNSLLFKGEEVLPTAATPQTARLSIIKGVEEGEEPGADIFFYTQEDWNQIEEQARKEQQRGGEGEIYSQVVQTAREKLGDRIRLYLGQKKTVGLSELEDYVAQNGKYSDIVKYTVLRISEMPFPELEVVDTPGINDPVRSREVQTIKFLEDADAAIFLPFLHRFLDKEDMNLVLRDMIRAGLDEVIVAVPQMDTLSPEQKEDFMKNCYERMTERAERFVNDMKFGPKARDLAKRVFCPENTVLVSAMADMLGRKLEQGEKLTEDEKFILEMMKRNNWSVSDPQKLRKESGMEELAEKIERKIVERKDAIILRGEFSKIEAGVNDLVAQTERRIEETERDLEGVKTRLEERKRQREAELKELEGFNSKVLGLLLSFEKELLKVRPQRDAVRVIPPEVVHIPWFDKEEEEDALADEISFDARQQFKDAVERLKEQYAEKFEWLENSIQELIPSLSKKSTLAREIISVLYSFERGVKKQLQAKRFEVTVNFSYGFFDKLFGGATSIAQGDVNRASREAQRMVREAIEDANEALRGVALENHGRLKQFLEDMQAERRKKLQELETAITHGEAEKAKLEKKLNEQMELFQKVKRVLGKIEPWVAKMRENLK